MRKPSTPLGTADRRPRIHIRPEPGGVTYSFGPCGERMSAPTPGAAVDLALQEIGHADAVIFHEVGVRHG